MVRLKTLLIRGNHLTNLPNGIGCCTSLTKLSLGDNEITHLPKTLGDCRELQSLWLGHNQIRVLPSTVGFCTKIDSLDLAANPMQTPSVSLIEQGHAEVLYDCRRRFEKAQRGPAPMVAIHAMGIQGECLVPDKRLEVNIHKKVEGALKTGVVNFNWHGLDEIPITLFHHMTLKDNLRELRMTGNLFTVLPEKLDHFHVLTTLILNNNKLTELPDIFGGLPLLKSLRLQQNLLERLPLSLTRLRALEELLLTGNKLVELPVRIGRLKSLETLFIDDNCLTEVPESIGDMKNLNFLIASDNMIQELPESIGKLSELQRFYINANLLTTVPDSLGQLGKLEELRLAVNRISSIPTSLGADDWSFEEAPIPSALRVLRLPGEMKRWGAFWAAVIAMRWKVRTWRARKGAARAKGLLPIIRRLNPFASPLAQRAMQMAKAKAEEMGERAGVNVAGLEAGMAGMGGGEEEDGGEEGGAKKKMFGIAGRIRGFAASKISTLTGGRFGGAGVAQSDEEGDESDDAELEQKGTPRRREGGGRRSPNGGRNSPTHVFVWGESSARERRKERRAEETAWEIELSRVELEEKYAEQSEHNILGGFSLPKTKPSPLALSLSVLWVNGNSIIELPDSFGNFQMLDQCKLDLNPMRSPPIELFCGGALGTREVSAYCHHRRLRRETLITLFSSRSIAYKRDNMMPRSTAVLQPPSSTHLNPEDMTEFDLAIDQYMNADYFNHDRDAVSILDAMVKRIHRREQEYYQDILNACLELIELMKFEGLADATMLCENLSRFWGEDESFVECFGLDLDVLFKGKQDANKGRSVIALLAERKKLGYSRYEFPYSRAQVRESVMLFSLPAYSANHAH